MARPKGSTNHQSKAIKDMIKAALDYVGGEKYFCEQAEKNPTAFMTLIGKVLPAEVNLGGQKDNPIVTSLPENDRAALEHYFKTRGITDAGLTK